jgi:hypothetical protein
LLAQREPISAVLLLPSSFLAIHQQHSSMAAEESAIRTLMSNWVNAYQRLDAKKLAALEDPNVEIVDRFGELHLPSGRSADQQLGRCFRIVSTNSPPDALASSVIASRRTGEHAGEQLRLNLLTCDHENLRETIEAFCFWLLM